MQMRCIFDAGRGSGKARRLYSSPEGVFLTIQPTTSVRSPKLSARISISLSTSVHLSTTGEFITVSEYCKTSKLYQDKILFPVLETAEDVLLWLVIVGFWKIVWKCHKIKLLYQISFANFISQCSTSYYTKQIKWQQFMKIRGGGGGRGKGGFYICHICSSSCGIR